MKIKEIKENLGNIDIYLLDQVFKGRYQEEDRILDAGCGVGRNSHYFIENNFSIYGIDQNQEAIDSIIESNKNVTSENYKKGYLNEIPFKDNFFDHIICNAVLHFAENTDDFNQMFSELVRVLKPNGTIFIRMTSCFGIEQKIAPLGGGVYSIPDGSVRFLLDEKLLMNLSLNFPVKMIEPLKTVNVDNARCMSNLLFSKI